MKYLSLILMSLLPFVGFAQSKLTGAALGTIEGRCIGGAAMSGRITAIEGVNRDPRIMYIGTAGGGVWKTTTGGSNFEPIFDKHCQSIGAIAIDQAHPDTIWAGTGESNMRNSVSIGNGIYKTTDGGENWVKMGLENSEHISRIVIHPTNPNVIFAAVPGHLWDDNVDRGLYKTSDGGKTWEKTLYVDEKTGCSEVIMDPKNPNILYATMWQFRRQPFAFNSGGAGSGIYKSIDGGKTWKKVTEGLPTGEFGRVALALAPSNTKHLLAIVESKKTELYISEDAGETWKQQSVGSNQNVTARPFYFSTLVIDPNDEKRVYRPAYTFSISTDGGYSYQNPQYFGGGVHPDHHALWINPLNTSQLWLGTDGGVYVSLDKGNNWNFMRNLPVGQFYHASYDLESPYNIYGGLQDNGSWKAPSRNTGGITNGDWKFINGGDGFWVQPDLTDNSIVYAEYQGGNMSRINLKYRESTDIQPYPLAGEDKLRWNWNTPICTSPTNPKILYTGAQYLYKTDNQGTTWTRISPDLTTNDKKKQKQEESGGLTVDNSSAENHCTIFTVSESPLDANTIWVGTDDGNLQMSADGGKNWNNLTDNYALSGIPKGTWVSSIEPSHFDKNTVYATFDNHCYGDAKTYLGKSTDNGKTWTMIASPEFTGFAHKIKEDAVNKNLLFLGTEMGLFVTVDGGKNWVRMKGGIPEYALVRDIQIHPKTHDLILATHGRGIIIVDDISPLRKLNDEVLASDFSFLETRPTPVTNGHFGGGGGNAGEFVAYNPSEEAPIIYYLKNRVMSGNVKVVIYTAKGDSLYELPGTRRKGINKIYWNMRMRPPKAAKTGSQMDFSGFTSPLVEPGVYIVKLKVADKVYDANIQLIEDPNTPHSKKDRDFQRETTMKLYNTVNDLAYFTQQVVDMQQQLKDYLEGGDADLKAKITVYNDSLENIRKTLVNTKEGTGITGEEKLREKLAGLYATVTYNEGRPTDSHLDRFKGLQYEIEQVKKRFTDNHTLYGDKISEVLRSSGMKGLKLLDRDTFDKMK
jgi:photosystem II stability/assembly factor-like uncharacterized protein